MTLLGVLYNVFPVPFCFRQSTWLWVQLCLTTLGKLSAHVFVTRIRYYVGWEVNGKPCVQELGIRPLRARNRKRAPPVHYTWNVVAYFLPILQMFTKFKHFKAHA